MRSVWAESVRITAALPHSPASLWQCGYRSESGLCLRESWAGEITPPPLEQRLRISPQITGAAASQSKRRDPAVIGGSNECDVSSSHGRSYHISHTLRALLILSFYIRLCVIGTWTHAPPLHHVWFRGPGQQEDKNDQNLYMLSDITIHFNSFFFLNPDSRVRTSFHYKLRFGHLTPHAQIFTLRFLTSSMSLWAAVILFG